MACILAINEGGGVSYEVMDLPRDARQPFLLHKGWCSFARVSNFVRPDRTR